MIKMKDSGIAWIGDIPSDWEIRKIKYISHSNLEVLPENYDTETEIKYVDIGSVTYEGGINQVQTFKFADAPSRARRVLHNGDTIISTVRTYLKAISYISDTYDKHIGSTGFSVITPSENIHKKFLYYALSSHSFISEVEANSVGISYPAITNTNLINLKIALPSLTKQYSLAEYLDEKCSKINVIIEKQQAVIEKLKEYKLSIITEAVTKGIVSNCNMKDCDIEWIGKMPAHWTKCRLSDVTQRIIVGLATSVTPYYRQEGTVLLRNLNIKEGYLDDSELLYLDIDFAENQTGKFINAGDVLTVHTGSNLGLSCVVPLKYENTLSFTTLITTPIREKLLPEYLMYTINSGLGKSEIDKLKCGDIKPNLNVRQFKYFTIFLPPIDEQKQIVLYLEQKLSQIDNMIFNKSKEIEKLQEYKKSLIYEVVTGKKEV